MGYQVIKQPNDKLAIFCSYNDSIIAWDYTRQDVLDFFVVQAANAERTRATQVVDAVIDGASKDVYHQFRMTWDEAVALDAIHGRNYADGSHGTH